MRSDDDPLLPPHWLAELDDGLGEPLLHNLWNTPAPEPVASAPPNANLMVRWSPNHSPDFVVPPIALRMGADSPFTAGGPAERRLAPPAPTEWPAGCAIAR